MQGGHLVVLYFDGYPLHTGYRGYISMPGFDIITISCLLLKILFVMFNFASSHLACNYHFPCD